MADTYALPTDLINQLRAIRDARMNDIANPNVNFSDAYQLLYNQIVNDSSVPAGIKNWLSVAISVNGGSPKDIVFQYVRAVFKGVSMR
jgi:hypothetical protein